MTNAGPPEPRPSSASSAGTLIVGTGEAAVQLASSLRQFGDEGPITMVGSEKHAPYQRPPLSKEFLTGAVDAATLAFRTPSFYGEQRIDVVNGQRIERIVLADDRPGAGLAIGQGREFAFDRLALAVGARPRRLQLPGSDLDGVCYLRGIDDALRLRQGLATADRVVVIGGGFIGLEAASVARSLGKDVVVVEAGPALISRSVAPVVSTFYHHAHRRRGVDVRLGTTVTELVGTAGHVSAVELSDGSRLVADLVLVAVGIVPRTRLAEQLGLRCDHGIVVDEYARTSNPAIVAIGDCTAIPNPMTGTGRIRLESVPNAVGQARVAAATLSGRLEPYQAVPWFWSDQYDLKLQMAGLADGHDAQVVRGAPESESFSVLCYRNGTLVAVNAVNRVGDYMDARRALTQGATIPPDRAADADTPLRQLVVAAGSARSVDPNRGP